MGRVLDIVTLSDDSDDDDDSGAVSAAPPAPVPPEAVPWISVFDNFYRVRQEAAQKKNLDQDVSALFEVVSKEWSLMSVSDQQSFATSINGGPVNISSLRYKSSASSISSPPSTAAATASGSVTIPVACVPKSNKVKDKGASEPVTNSVSSPAVMAQPLSNGTISDLTSSSRKEKRIDPPSVRKDRSLPNGAINAEGKDSKTSPPLQQKAHVNTQKSSDSQSDLTNQKKEEKCKTSISERSDPRHKQNKDAKSDVQVGGKVLDKEVASKADTDLIEKNSLKNKNLLHDNEKGVQNQEEKEKLLDKKIVSKVDSQQANKSACHSFQQKRKKDESEVLSKEKEKVSQSDPKQNKRVLQTQDAKEKNTNAENGLETKSINKTAKGAKEQKAKDESQCKKTTTSAPEAKSEKKKEKKKDVAASDPKKVKELKDLESKLREVNGGAAESGHSSSRAKCLGPGCTEPPVANPNWDNEYCSFRCCTNYVNLSFKRWVLKRKKEMRAEAAAQLN